MISTCAGPIIHLKDSIHRDWFNLQEDPLRINTDGITLLSYHGSQKIIDKAAEALSIARKCEADSSLIHRLDVLLERFINKLAEFQVTDYSGQPFYSMPKETVTDIVTVDINKLANAVHNLGSSLIKYGKYYAGCKLEEGEDVEEVNEGALSYCEGVAGTTASIQEHGTTIEHKLGLHKNVIRFIEDIDEYDISLDYTESGDGHWEKRQEGVVAALQEVFQFECESRRASTKCKGKIKAPQATRELAYFFSGLHDVDLLSEPCIEEAVAWALRQAQKTAEELKEESYRKQPYPARKHQWVDEVCGGEEEEEEEEADEEEERRARLRERIRTLDSNIRYWAHSAENIRLKLPELPCTLMTFEKAEEAELMRDAMDSACAELKELEAWWGGCSNDEAIVAEENKKAFGELLDRCSVASIVKTVEAKATGYKLKDALSPITRVCDIIRDADCLKEIKDALDRDAAGIKPLLLPL